MPNRRHRAQDGLRDQAHRTISDWAKTPTSELGRQQNGFASTLQSRLMNCQSHPWKRLVEQCVHSSISTDDEEGEELLDPGISVSDSWMRKT